nr:uncharacterized protein LOC116778402 [Danaus plexippus plexippus]
MEAIIEKMQDETSGVPVRTVKSFMTKIPSDLRVYSCKWNGNGAHGSLGSNIPKDHAIKVNKYYELTNELAKSRFVVNLYAVEVAARGITAISLQPAKTWVCPELNISSFLERESEGALVGSFQIWLGEELGRWRRRALNALDRGSLNLHLGRKSQAPLKLLSLQRWTRRPHGESMER